MALGRALTQREPAALRSAAAENAEEVSFWQFVQWQFDEQFGRLKPTPTSAAWPDGRPADLRGPRQRRLLGAARPLLLSTPTTNHRRGWRTARRPWAAGPALGQPALPLGPHGRGRLRLVDGPHQPRTHAGRCVRIDHFRGFAGYFEIPASPDATEAAGSKGQDLALFTAIRQSLGDLPIVAEDLGIITDDVHALREACGFPGMAILQSRVWRAGRPPYLPHNLKPGTVAYTGTHDNDTVLGWWHKTSARERAHAGSYLACSERDVHWAMIRACANSVASIAIYPMQDVLGLPTQHRMNVPGVIGATGEWRFHWDMVGAEPARVLGLITAGRWPWRFHAPCDSRLEGVPPRGNPLAELE